MTEIRQSFTLQPGTTTVRNPNAASARFVIETRGGTRIEIPLTRNGEFRITVGTDIVGADYYVLDATGGKPQLVRQTE